MANLTVQKITSLMNALQCFHKHVLFLSHTYLFSTLDCNGVKSNKTLMARIQSKHDLA